MAGGASCAPAEAAPDPAATDAIESIHRAWMEAHVAVDGMEVHSGEEITWMQGPGVGWSNAAVRLRLAKASADARLRAPFARARANGRGFGVWVSDLALPADLPLRLSRSGFRKRKRFPGMLAELGAVPEVRLPAGVEVRPVDDHSVFLRHPHPYFGPIKSRIRRFELERLTRLQEAHPRQVADIMAVRGGIPVGAATIFVHGSMAAFWDVGVLETERGRGIGSGLMAAGCALARERGAEKAVLLSSGMGYGVYVKAGFREVCRIAYWYAKDPGSGRG
jgi:GNAT superfamily N-acetyltransferase